MPYTYYFFTVYKKLMILPGNKAPIKYSIKKRGKKYYIYNSNKSPFFE